MNLVMMTEGTGQGVHGRKTNVGRLYDLLADWLCQRGFPVEYMGLWDTVDSTAGIKGEDYIELPTNVKFARHAVARDEQRRFFGYLPLKSNNQTLNNSNTVEEVVWLFDRILKDLRSYPTLNPDPHARLGREITEAWIRQFLRVKRGHPEWMVRGNLTQIPAKLGVSSGRVNDLVRQIYGKLGVHGKDELAKLV